MFPAKKLKSESKAEEWPIIAEGRYLRSTIPFDTHKAILFVSEGSQKISRKCEYITEEKNSEKLTGNEAKKLYEEVLSLPEESKRETCVVAKQKKPKRKRKRSCVGDRPHPISPSQLFFYTQNNQLDLLKSALTSQSYDINLCDEFQWTLVMSAAYAGHTSVVEYLLARGAEWKGYRDRRGMNAADLARMGGHHRIAEFIESFDTNSWEMYTPGIETTVGDIIIGKGEQGDCKASKQKGTFYCELCQMAMKATPKSSHNTSTIHLFCCQHQQHSQASYGIMETNRGFQMLLRSGWNPEKGLGSSEQGKKFPVKTVLKQDRTGLGLERGKARVTHFSSHDREAVRFHRERYRKEKLPKNKKDILKERKKDRAWEVRMRTILNEDD